ncbi:hypothetical protein HaLaN_10774 [Haematococcus lacustris]|uniref:Uncharacterized protein n=1 Tax=Haematococcus lacustris TaxID=44745 RepID=A0A699ZGE9_HAELA|nr:hypothetical protein HaLaN_10774 [Haematococcus lacustris]
MECLPFLPASRSGKPSRQSSSITDSPFVPAPSMNPLFQLAMPSHTQGMSQDAWNPTTSDFSAQCVLEPASAGWDGEILTQVPFVTCLLDLSGSSLLYCPGLPQPPPSQASTAESAFLLQILGGDVDALTEVLASTGKGMTWQGSLAGQAQAGTRSSAAAVPELVTPASTVSQLQLARPFEAEHPVLLQAAEQSISLHKASHPGPLPKDSMQQTRTEGAMNGYGSLLAESATDAFLLTLSPFPVEQQPIHRGCSNLSNTPLADTCPVDMQAHEEGLDDAIEDTGIEAYSKARHSPVRRCITSVNVVKRRLPSRMRNQSKTAVMLERMLHAKSVTDQVSAGMAPSIGASSGPSSLIEDSLAFQLPGLPEAMMDSEPGRTTQRWGLLDAGGGMVSPAKSFSQQLPQVSPACQMGSGDEAQRPVLQHTPSGLQPTALVPLSSSFTSSRGGHRVRRHSSLRSVTCLEEPELRQRLESVADAASGTVAMGSEVGGVTCSLACCRTNTHTHLACVMALLIHSSAQPCVVPVATVSCATPHVPVCWI